MGDFFINLEGALYYDAIYFQKTTVTHREAFEAGSKAFLSGLRTVKN